MILFLIFAIYAVIRVESTVILKINGVIGDDAASVLGKPSEAGQQGISEGLQVALANSSQIVGAAEGALSEYYNAPFTKRPDFPGPRPLVIDSDVAAALAKGEKIPAAFLTFKGQLGSGATPEQRKAFANIKQAQTLRILAKRSKKLSGNKPGFIQMWATNQILVENFDKSLLKQIKITEELLRVDAKKVDANLRTFKNREIIRKSWK